MIIEGTHTAAINASRWFAGKWVKDVQGVDILEREEFYQSFEKYFNCKVFFDKFFISTTTQQFYFTPDLLFKDDKDATAFVLRWS